MLFCAHPVSRMHTALHRWTANSPYCGRASLQTRWWRPVRIDPIRQPTPEVASFQTGVMNGP